MEKVIKGDIIVSTIDQYSSDRENPFLIRKDYIDEAYLDNDKYVFFSSTPAGRGSYNISNFRLATNQEKEQFYKGRALLQPFCPFEEDELVTCITYTTSIKGDFYVLKDTVHKIDGIIKTKDLSKTIMYFDDVDGYYKIDNFRKPTDEEIGIYEDRKSII